MKLALTFAVAAAAALMALPAAAQPDSPCFMTRDLRNHTVADDHTLYFDVGGRAVYRATMSNNCLAGAVSSDPIVLRDRTGSGRICKPIELDVGVGQSRCIAQSLTRLTPAEAAALPKNVRP